MNKSIGALFPIAFTQFTWVCVSHSGNSHDISSLLFYLLWWSVIFNVTTVFVLEHHKLCPYMITNLNQQILSMFWVLHWPPISLPLLDKVKVLVTQSCPTLCNPMNCSLPGSSVMEFFRQEYWSGLPFPSPGDLPNPGI